MSTDAQPPQDGEWIPRYFSEFRKEFDAFKEENARQHAELAARISSSEVDTAERSSSLETHVAERFSSLETHVAERFSSLETRFTERFSNLETRIAEMEARLMWRGLGGLAVIASLAVAAARFLPA